MDSNTDGKTDDNTDNNTNRFIKIPFKTLTNFCKYFPNLTAITIAIFPLIRHYQTITYYIYKV